MNNSQSNQLIQEIAPTLFELFGSLVNSRSIGHDLSHLLGSIEVKSAIDSTKAMGHFYFLNLDGNGRPRVEDLAYLLRDNIINYAIPRSMFYRAKQALNDTNSSEELLRLEREAKSLFTDIKKTGECGEVLLFLLAERILNLPQLFCKMQMKTSGQVHIHGSDGIHAGVNEDNKLILYWGESKLYKNLSTAINDCFDSLAPFLKETGPSGKQENELRLLRANIDLHNPDLEAAIKNYLDRHHDDFLKLQFNGLCLVGFDLSLYPSQNKEKTLVQLAGEMKSELIKWKTNISNSLELKNLENFNIHVFCIPFPCVQEFREIFLKAVGK
jgi:hypothetical protein